MTLGTIILIVLGIAVLVFLIFGFSTGWTNLWDRIINVGGGESNLATIETSCQLACSTNSRADYCTTNRTISFGGDKKDRATCNEIIQISKKDTTRFSGLKVQDCTNLCT